MRVIGVSAAVLLVIAGLTACTPTVVAPEPSAAVPEPTPTPSEPAIDPDAIRDVDFGAMTWTWDTLGEQYSVALSDGAGKAQDPYYDAEATFSLGEAVYSDANGDGLTDAALPLTWDLGNGTAENWFIWLAQEDGGEPQQLPYPIASSARCGNASATMAPIDGGFRVDEVVRSALESAAACAQSGSLQRTRDITVVGDGTSEGSWPTTKDGAGWGGYCPVKQITEGVMSSARGMVGPSKDAPLSTVSGEQLYSPLQTYPFREPNGWHLSGFITDKMIDSVVCVWMPAA